MKKVDGFPSFYIGNDESNKIKAAALFDSTAQALIKKRKNAVLGILIIFAAADRNGG